MHRYLGMLLDYTIDGQVQISMNDYIEEKRMGKPLVVRAHPISTFDLFVTDWVTKKK